MKTCLADFFVPRPAFEIAKSGTIRLNSKAMKFKLNQTDY